MHMQATDYGEKKYTETKRLIRNAMRERQLVLFVSAGASASADAGRIYLCQWRISLF